MSLLLIRNTIIMVRSIGNHVNSRFSNKKNVQQFTMCRLYFRTSAYSKHTRRKRRLQCTNQHDYTCGRCLCTHLGVLQLGVFVYNVHTDLETRNNHLCVHVKTCMRMYESCASHVHRTSEHFALAHKTSSVPFVASPHCQERITRVSHRFDEADEVGRPSE